jgi:Peptidase_C39 like family
MAYLTATKDSSGKVIRTGADVKFRAGAVIAGTPQIGEGGILKFKLAGAIAGLGLQDKDFLILTYADWSPKEATAPAPTPTVIAPASSFPQSLMIDKFPYFSQRDARGHGEAFRMCNTSSNAMVASYLLAVCGLPNPLIEVAKKDGIGEDDVFLLDYVHEFGDSTDHDAITRALRKLGIESEFHYDLTIDDLRKSLGLGIPMVLGVLHHGSVAAPSGGGHMIAAVKLEADGNTAICYDPYGEGFSYQDTNGKAVKYPINPTLTARWLCGDPRGGWGRIFTKVGGLALPKVR